MIEAKRNPIIKNFIFENEDNHLSKSLFVTFPTSVTSIKIKNIVDFYTNK